MELLCRAAVVVLPEDTFHDRRSDNGLNKKKGTICSRTAVQAFKGPSTFGKSEKFFCLSVGICKVNLVALLTAMLS